MLFLWQTIGLTDNTREKEIVIELSVACIVCVSSTLRKL